MHTNAVVMHYSLDYEIPGTSLFRNDNFLVRPPDLIRGKTGLAEGTSSERKSIVAAGFGETDRASFGRNRYPPDETPCVLRFTEVIRALTDRLRRSVVGRIEGGETSSLATPASISPTTSCSSISGSLCIIVSRRDS